jgi:hypothetical protein
MIIPSSRGFNFQNEDAHLAIWDLHHKDVASTSNLGMTFKVDLHSLVQLKAHKTWSYVTP